MRVVIGSDHPLIREGLSSVIDNSANIVGSISDWRALLSAAAETHPDLILLDVEHAGFGWIRATQQIQRFSPDTIVTCISSSGDLDFLEEMRAAGARTKPINSKARDEILAFIQGLTGASLLPPLASQPNPARALTSREREILRRVARGSTSQEIAEEFGVSIRTVEFHRANILRKTGTRTVADVTRFAIQNGVLPNDTQ